MILATSQKEMDEYGMEIEAVRKDLQERMEALSKLVNDQGAQALKTFEGHYREYLDLHGKVVALTRENGNALAFGLASGKGRELCDQAEKAMRGIVEKNISDMERDKQLSNTNYASAKWMMLPRHFFLRILE